MTVYCIFKKRGHEFEREKGLAWGVGRMKGKKRNKVIIL